MRLTVFGLILAILNTTYSEKENLTCISSKSKSGCQCSIKTDEVTLLPSVEAVCQYLELQEFPTIISSEKINLLDLSHNNIKELRLTDLNTDIGETVLTLNLCHNSIIDINDGFFDSFVNLHNLDLSHNYISQLTSKELFNKLNNLTVLDISFNQISNIVPDGIFKDLKKLEKINLSYNPLFTILENPTSIMDKFGIHENVLHVNFDNIGITKIHNKCWNYFKKIKVLSVADNPIDEIPQTSSTLEYLDISGTNITNLHENYLKYPNLKILKMSRIENLTEIPHYAFYNLGNLEELILSDSPKLSLLNEYVFGLLSRRNFPRQLKKFELARNRLKSLNETYLYIFQEMDNFDISFNSWSCDCRLLWLRELESNMRRKSDMRCASPKDMVNKKVLELQPQDLPNCYPEIYGKQVHQTALLILIMIVFGLIIIIIYLCLYSPRWSIKIGRRNISPDSPYSINNEQI